jgi:hypothetical protein
MDTEPGIQLQKKIDFYKENKLIETGKISDGYHTFDELYYHRMVLFSIICNQNKQCSWKSWLHHDGTMFDDYFIVGITTPEGNFTYHYHKDNWDMFDVANYDKAPEWDGHLPEDITRLLLLLEV